MTIEQRKKIQIEDQSQADAYLRDTSAKRGYSMRDVIAFARENVSDTMLHKYVIDNATLILEEKAQKS